MSAREHCCAFCGSVMRLLLLPAADGSGKRLCCWQCEAAGRMDHVCWTDDTYCRDCGGAAAVDASALLGAGRPSPGTKVTCNGYDAVVARWLDWSHDLVEVRLQSGEVCIDWRELSPRGGTP